MALITVVRALAGLSWLAVIGAIGFAVVRAARGQKAGGATSLLVVIIVVAAVLNVVSAGLVFVEPNEAGVVVTIGEGGVRPDALPAGLHWIVPFAETVVTYPTSRQTYTMSIAPSEGNVIGDDSVQARTSDGQVVFVDATVIFAVDQNRVVDVHRNWLSNYTDGLVRPLARGIIRDTVATFAIEEVYSTERIQLITLIEDEMFRVLNEEGFILVDFVLRNIAFSDEYAASVEQKQIAEQLAQQAVFVVEQKKQEAEQARQAAQGEADAAVIRAEGQAQSLIIQAQAEAEARLIQAEAEAEALRLLAAAIDGNPDILLLQYIEKLAPNISVMLLPSNNPFLFPIPGLDSSSISIPQ